MHGPALAFMGKSKLHDKHFKYELIFMEYYYFSNKRVRSEEHHRNTKECSLNTLRPGLVQVWDCERYITFGLYNKPK